eukprot:gene7880-5661_t
MPRTSHSHTGNDGHGPFKKFLKKDSAVIYDKYQALEFIGEITQARHMKYEVIRTLGSPAGLHAIDCCLNIVAEEDPSPRDWETLNKIFVLIANKKLWEGLLKHEIEKISSAMFGIEAFWQRLPPAIGSYLRETESISLILCFSECRGILSASSLSRTVVDQIVSRVIASPFAGSEEKMMMQNVFLTTNPTEPVSIQNLPSQSDLFLWRQLHDNDHLDDFRKVSSFPTIDELNLPDYPIEYMYRGWRNDKRNVCGKHIDRQFRLLRCDMLATLREELKSWRDSQGKVLHYSAPVVIGADFDEGIGVVVNVAFPLPDKAGRLLRSKYSSSKDKAKVKSSQSKFFDEEGRYILPFNTLIIFANERKQVLATGVVLKRDTSEMMKVALDTLPSSSIKKEMETYQKELQDCTYPLDTFRNIFPSFKSVHMAIGFVPSLASIIPRAAFQPITSDNYRNVGTKGKIMEDTDIFDKWKKGQPRPEYVRPHQVWDLSLEQRTQRNKDWFQAYRQQCSDKLASIVSSLNSLAANLKSLKDEPRSESFAQATIVACTTSYAAKNRHVLHDTDFDTVLVEEAAEIHESHILVNLKESTKRLIMIGDHKQLRPKLEHYPLRVESGRGIDFDRSMFERLILMGYPYSTLDTQHPSKIKKTCLMLEKSWTISRTRFKEKANPFVWLRLTTIKAKSPRSYWQV